MTLLRRIQDALRTLLDGNPTVAEKRFRRLESEARELIADVDSTVEKLNLAFAREAKRQSRAAARLVKDDQDPAGDADRGSDGHPDGTTGVLSMDPAVRKSQLRMRAQREGLM